MGEHCYVDEAIYFLCVLGECVLDECVLGECVLGECRALVLAWTEDRWRLGSTRGSGALGVWDREVGGAKASSAILESLCV